MRTLSRVPFWGWLLILTIFSYLVWNPSKFSVFHMRTPDGPQWPLPAKLLVTLVVVGILVFFFIESKKAIGNIGLSILAVIFALVIWLFVSLGVLDTENAGILKYIAPFICAIFLTVGSQFNKIRRSISGTVSVDHTSDDHGDLTDHVDGHH